MSTDTLTATDPRVCLTLAKREHETTHWIEGEYPADARPDAMFAAFEAAGWILDPITEAMSAYEPTDFDDTNPIGQRATPRGYQVKDFSLTKPGTDLFTGWTVAEATANMREARTILQRFGFTSVPVWAKTLTDML